MSYRVRLQVYEGPLELLVHLIESQEIDIWDIPVAHITDQYLDYLATLRELNLEVGGEFLVMAATLLAIKARMLLPESDAEEAAAALDEEEDPREELIRRLVEYRRFRRAGRALDDHLKGRGVVAGRGSPPQRGQVVYTHPIGSVTLFDLVRAFRQVLEAQAREPRPFVHPAVREITVEERFVEVLRIFHERSSVSLYDLFSSTKSRSYIVVTFLAVLEVLRRGIAVANQPDPFGPILLDRHGDPPAAEDSPATPH